MNRVIMDHHVPGQKYERPLMKTNKSKEKVLVYCTSGTVSAERYSGTVLGA
jgi:hypothetical protein